MVESTLRTYAGIGSRQITPAEAVLIRNLARSLASRGYWLHSGNALGADQAFQEGAGPRALAFLPSADYNKDICPGTPRFCQLSPEATQLARELHPQGATLSPHSLRMMTRNVQMIDGVPGHPRVEFIVCCADPVEGGVKGGSALAYRLAKRLGIPFINIREQGWDTEFHTILGMEN